MNRTTILVGAGAALDFEQYGIWPSTENITDEVLKLSTQTLDGNSRHLIREVSDYIHNKLKEVAFESNEWSRKHMITRLNFEDILHVLEMCTTYSFCWHKGQCNWKSYPIFGAVVEPSEFIIDIATVDFERACFALQERIMEIVNMYDYSFLQDESKNLWYRRFWRSFNGQADIFTLNYDTTIENSIEEYEDGFLPIRDGERYSHFSARKYYSNKQNLSTVSHLHGQILFSEAKEFPFDYSIRDFVKNRNYEIACSNRQLRQSNPVSQAQEMYVQPYIVSGKRKIEKLTFSPNNAYLSNLHRKIIENHNLLIIGYSFGDLYLNELVGAGMEAHGDNFRVAIIDKFPQHICSYSALYKHIMNSYSGAYRFISRMCRNRLSIEIGQTESPLSQPFDNERVFVSQNGRLIILIDGFKDAVTDKLSIINHFFSS